MLAPAIYPGLQGLLALSGKALPSLFPVSVNGPWFTGNELQKYGAGSMGTAIGAPYHRVQSSSMTPDECRS